MQQTQNYKLNLIEASDTFSPNPLNENMEKLEGALAGVRAEAADSDAALDQRIQVFEARHLVAGTYTPQPNGLNVNLGFQPRCVLIRALGTATPSGILLPEYPTAHGKITDNGFYIAKAGTEYINHHSTNYGYIAFD